MHTFLGYRRRRSQRKVGDNVCLDWLAWSPDSQWLACTAANPDDRGLVLVRAESGQTRRLTSARKPNSDQQPAFSADAEPSSCSSTPARTTTIPTFGFWISTLIFARAAPHKQITSLTPLPRAVWAPNGKGVVDLQQVHVVHAGSLPRPGVRIGRAAGAGDRRHDAAVARSRNRLVYSRWPTALDIWRADGATAHLGTYCR